ncbi:sulfite exporter TauE/SafE family protein [Methylotenera sp.]|uniref:sulfite exporter TauE/SafE family protein n=1 Tax=Methylotenera sp. TaxID=2051956 RepID=UPI002EDB0BB0
MIDPNLIAILLGIVIGFLMAITGAGGAILSLPLLMYFFNMEIKDAAPIALLAIFIAAGSAALIGLRQGVVRYKAATLLAVMGVLMAPLGVYVAHSVAALWLHLLFMLLLFYVGAQALVATQSSNLMQDSLYHHSATPCEINPLSTQLFWTASCTKRLLLTGAVAGFLSGLLGVGGGFIVMPVLQKISNLKHRMVVATSLAMTALVALVSVISYASYSAIQWQVAIPFALATLAGSLVGKLMSATISISQSRFTFGIVSLFIALAMLLNMVFE